jgi:hypothetical protein
MTVVQPIVRVCSQTALILLAAGIVVAATYALTPRFNPKKAEAAAATQTEKHPPSLASQIALRQAISEAQRGVTDYDRVRKARAKLLANFNPLQRIISAIYGYGPVPTDKEILNEVHLRKQIMADMGPLRSMTYLGRTTSFDRYRVTFQHGTALWLISLGKNGALEDSRFNPEGVPSPRMYIESYARPVLRERSGRLVTQLCILLLVAAFGRFALRLRL